MDSSCVVSEERVERHEKLLSSLDEKMDDVLKEVKKYNVININNGDDGTTPVTYIRDNFFQMIYDRTSLKHKFGVISTFSTKAIAIIQLVVLLITLYVSVRAYTSLHDGQAASSANQEKIIDRQDHQTKQGVAK